jgi:hypothetical protein
MIRLTSKFQNGAVKTSTLEKALVQFVDRMDDQEALQRVTARKNNNVGGQVYIPAIDYNVPDLFAGEYASKKMEFSILASVLAQMDCEKEEEEEEEEDMEMTDAKGATKGAARSKKKTVAKKKTEKKKVAKKKSSPAKVVVVEEEEEEEGVVPETPAKNASGAGAGSARRRSGRKKSAVRREVDVVDVDAMEVEEDEMADFLDLLG